MKHATKNKLMAIPVFTLLVTVSLVACEQPWDANRDTLQFHDIQEVDPETPIDEPGIQAEENTLERWQPLKEAGTTSGSIRFGQREVFTSTAFDPVVFRLKERQEMTLGWIRMIPSSTDSKALSPVFRNRQTNDPVASTEYQAPVERLN